MDFAFCSLFDHRCWSCDDGSQEWRGEENVPYREAPWVQVENSDLFGHDGWIEEQGMFLHCPELGQIPFDS